jgi:hypothetical protein
LIGSIQGLLERSNPHRESVPLALFVGRLVHQSTERIGDSLPFFGRIAITELQFVKSVVNCGLCCLEAIWEFLIISF